MESSSDMINQLLEQHRLLRADPSSFIPDLEELIKNSTWDMFYRNEGKKVVE